MGCMRSQHPDSVHITDEQSFPNIWGIVSEIMMLAQMKSKGREIFVSITFNEAPWHFQNAPKMSNV